MMPSTISPGFLLLVVIFFLALTLGSLTIGVKTTLKNNDTMTRRLAGVPGSGGGQTPRRRASKNMIAVFGQHLSLPGPEEITKIRFSLSQAGFYNPKAVQIFYAIRVAALLLPQFAFLIGWGFFASRFETGTLVLMGCGLIFCGLFAPLLFIRSRIKGRRLNAKEGFPDMVDLLVSCIEAGLGLDAALMNVSKEIGERYPSIKVNLDLLNLELMAGRSRHEALKNFSERLGLEEVKALAVMIRQSEEMGSSLGKSLRTFSDEMRSKRMLKAEEKALALSAKLTVPLIVFIFPTIMGMLLLPAGVRLSGAF